jgi:abortive infection bacteriophage resistance protein
MHRPALSIREQVLLLKGRGLEFLPGEETEIEAFLLNVNYYRAAGYWRFYFNAPNDALSGLKSGTAFGQIRNLYSWDEELRRLLLEGLAKYEITFRARLAHFFCMYLPPTSYLDPDSYNEVFHKAKKGMVSSRSGLLDSVKRDLQKSSDPSVIRFTQENQTPPIWVAIEVFSMGTLSKMYSVALDDIRFKLSKSLRLPSPEFAETLFHSLTIFRNHLAHHGRIWRWTPSYPPQVLKSLKVEQDRSIYERTPWGLIVSLMHQIDLIDGSSDWSSRLTNHINCNQNFKFGLTHPRH